jgi:hypothetical protein
MDLDEIPVTALYIMGAGHSGSTVLDIMLGNHPEIVGVGELGNFTLPVRGNYCACGQPSGKCGFWSEVQRKWTHRVGVDGVAGYQVAQEPFEKLRYWFRSEKEKRGVFQSPRYRVYAEHTRALFESIAVASGKRIIVDSSKSPARALALSGISGFDLRIIHLVRDGRGVVWSLMKKKAHRKNALAHGDFALPWFASLGWLLTNGWSDFVLRRGEVPGVRVKYEDLVGQPEKALDRIGRMLEIKFNPVVDHLFARKELAIGHNIAGNRIRKAGSIRLRPDYEWNERLPGRYKRLFWLLAGSRAKKYGYRWD